MFARYSGLVRPTQPRCRQRHRNLGHSAEGLRPYMAAVTEAGVIADWAAVLQ